MRNWKNFTKKRQATLPNKSSDGIALERKGLKAEEIAQIVGEIHITVLRWLKGYLAEGIKGWKDHPRPGRSTVVTEGHQKHLLEIVRKRPRSLGLEYSMLTLQHLSDYMAEEMGERRLEVAELLQALVGKHPTGTIYVAWDDEVEEVL